MGTWTEQSTLSVDMATPEAGTGQVMDHLRVMNDHAFYVQIISTPSGPYSIQMRGSLDDNNFYDLGGELSDSGGQLVQVTDFPARYILLEAQILEPDATGNLQVSVQVIGRP